MAINLNRIEVIGNLTRDPELRYTPNGQAVASFAVATNRRYPDKSGNWIDAEPEYHEVVAWVRLAEGVNKTLKKGDRVFVSGRTQTQSWEGQDGNKRTRTEIVADTILGPDQVLRSTYESSAGPAVQAAPAFNKSQASNQGTEQTTNQTDSQPAAEATVAGSDSASVGNDKPAPADNSNEEINIEDIPF